jgi:hypothetical protein
MNIEEIAEINHEANVALCNILGETTQGSWVDAPYWQRESSINGVRVILSNKDAKPEDAHNIWMKEKYEARWIYGPTKDPDKKEHPCLKPFNKLAPEQQAKDHLFLNIVRALEPFIEK